MGPVYKTDYDQYDKISTILEDRRLRDEKYGGVSFKHVAIDCGQNVYHANSSFLRMLLEKYGDINFKKSISDVPRGSRVRISVDLDEHGEVSVSRTADSGLPSDRIKNIKLLFEAALKACDADKAIEVRYKW